MNFPKWSKHAKESSASQQGFTIVEIVIVLAIIVTLFAVTVAAQPQYRVKIQDNQRKGHLQRMKTAFEDYAGDNECYPPATLLTQCKSTAMQPYLTAVLCDPATKQPYTYIRSDDCTSFTMYANLENVEDPAIETSGCATGCGPNGSTQFNYQVKGGQEEL